MEIIGVRTTVSNRKLLETRLHKMVEEAKRIDPVQSIRLFIRLSIESDLSIHLKHESKSADLQGSRLGLLLANEMKAFGLVHHSIWAEPTDLDAHREGAFE